MAALCMFMAQGQLTVGHLLFGGVCKGDPPTAAAGAVGPWGRQG